MNKLDLFTGIGGWIVASERVGIKTIFTSEIDNYNCKLIDKKLNLENAGDIKTVCINQSQHPYHNLINEKDFVPVESTGISSLCIEDFYNDILPFPEIITGSFPCQDLSQANLHGSVAGIKGKRSGLVEEQLRIIEALEPKYAVFENAKNLAINGLSSILLDLKNLGYNAQWQTVSATAFGYPHYRHRVYLVAYRDDSGIAKSKTNIFESIKRYTHNEGVFKLPVIGEDDQWIGDFAKVENTRSIRFRTKRLNGLGNSIMPDIGESIFRVLIDAESDNQQTLSKLEAISTTHGFVGDDLVDHSNLEITTKLTPSGSMLETGICCNPDRDYLLNPTNTFYKNLWSTLLSRDGNNNFSCKSRLNRPGKLGGLVGDIMRLGHKTGGLDPLFCEQFMGYEFGYTDLDQPL